MLQVGGNQYPWPVRLGKVMETMRELSRQTDPQQMVKAYGARVAELIPSDRRISLSRRGLNPPQFRITRYSGWTDDINPWKEPHRLPLLSGGFLSHLIYGDQPQIINDLELDESDPAWPYLEGQRSLVAIPMLDQGMSLNMVVLTRSQANAFDPEDLPEQVWMGNLFGRAAHNLVLADQVRAAYEEVDRELKAVADIQRSLLPQTLPEIPTLRLAAYYQTARRAGGDYYDFFKLPRGQYGILVADVSGHGTPAAVMMAVMHSIAHNFPGPPDTPAEMLQFLNRKLCDHYVMDHGTFVTAFYGIYDPEQRTLTYSSAGHNPPRLRMCGRDAITGLDGARRIPLGITADLRFENAVQPLAAADQLVFYTDGIVEAASPSGELFGTDRLDAILNRCTNEPDDIVTEVLRRLEAHTEGQPPSDDRTLVVAKVV